MRNTFALLSLLEGVLANDILLEMLIHTDLAFSKHIEDLLDSCLFEGVLRNLEFVLMGFELTEDLPD